MKIKVTTAPFIFDAILEMEKAPKTRTAFLAKMPFSSKIVHVRWSGDGV